MVLITQSDLSAPTFKGAIRVHQHQPHPSLKLKAPSCCLTTDVLNDCYSEAMAYTALAYSVFTTCMDAKVTPTNNTDHTCHINHRTYSTNHIGSYQTTSY